MENIRIALWGNTSYGIFLKTAYDLLHPEGIEFVCYGTEKNEGRNIQNGIPVFDMQKIAEMYRSGEIHAVVLALHHSRLHQAACRLMLSGIFDLYYLPHYDYELSIDDFSFNMLERIDTPKPRLDYLEFHLADHCNLNCKGCAHLSNITEPSFPDFDQYVKDMERLRELFWGIERIRLMGGEPLLNKELPNYIAVTRQIFPDADMYVVSNGLILGEADESLFRIMHEHNCGFNISQYPPTTERIDHIRALCELYKVRCLVSSPLAVFRTCTDPDGAQRPEDSYAKCDVTHCTFLRNGTISNCIMPYILPRYSEMYGKEMSAGEADIIDIHAPDIDGLWILEKLHKPIESCRYCNPAKTYVYEWDTAPKGKARPEDWTYRE